MDRRFLKHHYYAAMTEKELVLALLDKAVLNLKKAISAIENQNYQESHSLLIDTQDICLELQSMQLMDNAPTRRTESFFCFLSDRLVVANINCDSAQLEELCILLQRLRVIYAAQLGKMG